ncbi:MAG: protein pyrBI [Lachnospiraceae bacterium]|nr:protein pyrBI [Lachnospiraceae bacterium]
MRRIASACLLQTMRFDTMNGANPAEELEIYCRKLHRSGTRYVIEEKISEPDGSLLVKVKKQYNSYKTDGYID